MAQYLDFNPRAPCGARLSGPVLAPFVAHISIHAPLAGRDLAALRDGQILQEFQSTRPLRGATGTAGRTRRAGSHFNPRAPCGARRLKDVFFRALYVFQSTRPLRGATTAFVAKRSSALFQSTRPLRGATVAVFLQRFGYLHFNPRAPCGARLRRHCSTSAAGRISIHAPLAGRDQVCRSGRKLYHISIHAPLAGRDCIFSQEFDNIVISIHAPLAGRDPSLHLIISSAFGFQSTRPLRGATSASARR